LANLSVTELKHIFNKLSPVWAIVISYQLITIILTFIYEPGYLITPGFIISRLIIIIYLSFRLIGNSEILKKYGILCDALIVYVMLAFFYGETAVFNTYLFPKIDTILSSCDQYLFGFQPSILFSGKFNHPLFSELMFMGYFSYYLMPLVALLMIWILKRNFFEKFSFIVISAYFLYYLIFILLPAEGPQFFFVTPLNQIEAHGPFAFMIKLIQTNGEAPTAAFPSSHIGIMVIILILLYQEYKFLFKVFLPFTIVLLFSTVYIKAHYFVDVVAGLISGFFILSLNKFIYLKVNNLRNI
jgi:membrane-associated phospholipid phosphatase